jgi:hypothetical protein
MAHINVNAWQYDFNAKEAWAKTYATSEVLNHCFEGIINGYPKPDLQRSTWDIATSSSN